MISRATPFSLALALGLSAGAPALAIGPADTAGCDYALRGPVGAEHAGMIEGIGRSYDGVVLCLHGNEGQLDHALDLLEAIWRYNVMTYVPAGWACEGPCAIAFMGGSVSTGSMNLRYTDRYVHPLGRIAFYLPEIDIPAGGSATDMENAFARGVAATGRLEGVLALSENGAEAMPLWVLTSILGGTPDDPVVLTTADADRADVIFTENPG